MHRGLIELQPRTNTIREDRIIAQTSNQEKDGRDADLPGRQLIFQLAPLGTSKGPVSTFSNGDCALQLVDAPLKQSLQHTGCLIWILVDQNASSTCLQPGKTLVTVKRLLLTKKSYTASRHNDYLRFRVLGLVLTCRTVSRLL